MDQFLICINQQFEITNWNNVFKKQTSLSEAILYKSDFRSFILDSEKMKLITCIKESSDTGQATSLLQMRWPSEELSTLYKCTLCSIRNLNEELTMITGERHDQIVRCKDELTRAKEVQRSFLPSLYKDAFVEIQTVYQPAEVISGDSFFYVTEIEPGVLTDLYQEQHLMRGFLIDVMGHGLATGLTVSALHTLFSQEIRKGWKLEELVRHLNSIIDSYLPDAYYVAAIFFEFDFVKEQLKVVPAGIHYFYKQSCSEMQVFERASYALGMFKNVEFPAFTVEIQKEEEWYFLSDGFYEQNVVDVLKNECSLDEKVERLKQMRRIGPHQDDRSAVLIKVGD
ncbi:PP2C family protein-serine/threonine phosphatase [Bacillus sp. FJAT-45037]|uniref:PP2C family protein-serine/threonine phosphatase n=1 Tax=Bacillus sp. FJAT-45037 TaxID=2011007 RepID=UPI000C2364BE|nr:PP2C family protein-serine/threonine phosphatase [Bacillus sp. FJAT-45037]